MSRVNIEHNYRRKTLNKRRELYRVKALLLAC